MRERDARPLAAENLSNGTGVIDLLAVFGVLLLFKRQQKQDRLEQRSAGSHDLKWIGDNRMFRQRIDGPHTLPSWEIPCCQMSF